MTPELSRACAQVKQILNLPSGGQEMESLLAAAGKADSVDGLPRWARGALAYADRQSAK